MLLIDENGIKMDAVYFGEAQEFVDFVQAHDTISVTYYPEINVFQGRRKPTGGHKELLLILALK